MHGGQKRGVSRLRVLIGWSRLSIKVWQHLNLPAHYRFSSSFLDLVAVVHYYLFVSGTYLRSSAHCLGESKERKVINKCGRYRCSFRAKRVVDIGRFRPGC